MGFIAFVDRPGGAGPREGGASVHVDRVGGVPPLLPRPVPPGHLRLDLRPPDTVAGMELAFLPATEQARLVREREVSPLELVELYLERIERLDPELGAYVTVRGEEALADARREGGRAGRGAVPRRADLAQGSRHDGRDPDDVLLARVRFERPRLRPRPRHPAQGGRLRDPRQDEHARVRDDGVHRLRAERPLPHAVGPHAERRRLERRRRRPRSRPASARSRRARTAAARSGSRRRAAASSASRPRAAAISNAPFVPGIGLGTTGPLARTMADAAAYLDARRAATSGATRFRPPPPERPFAEEIGVDPGRLRVAFTTEPPGDCDVDDACVAAARDAADLLASLGHEVEEASARLGRPRPDGGLQAGLADGAALYPVRDPSVLSPLNQAFLQGARETSSARTRLRSRACSCRARKNRLVLVGLRPAADADPRAAARAPSAGRRSPTIPGSNSTGRRGSRRSRPRSTSPASRRCRCRSTGRPTGCRSASSSSALRSATRSCSASPRRLEAARPWADSPAAALVSPERRTSGTVIPLRERPCVAETYKRRAFAASQMRPTLIRIDWPARACSISAALPLLIATDMFR